MTDTTPPTNAQGDEPTWLTPEEDRALAEHLRLGMEEPELKRRHRDTWLQLAWLAEQWFAARPTPATHAAPVPVTGSDGRPIYPGDCACCEHPSAATHTEPSAQTQVRRYAEASAVTERARGDQDRERGWLDLLALLAAAQAPAPSPAIDAAHLARQREWSARTFGPGRRTGGVCDHIRKELQEIQDDPDDVREWVDVVILALDGAWRTGAEPQEIVDAIRAKQTRNEARTWPDWRTMSPDRAIEHVRDGDA